MTEGFKKDGLSEADKGDVHDLFMEAVDARAKIPDELDAIADTLDKVWWNCKIAHAVGTTSGIISGCLTLAGVTVATGGVAAPLLYTGLGLGIIGSLINLGTSSVESSITSAKIEEAEKLWGEALDRINAVHTTVQSWLDKKEKTKVYYFLYLAEDSKLIDPAMLDLLYDIVSPGTLKHGEKLVKSVGAGITQTSDDVAQAGTKAWSKTAEKCAGKVLPAVNIVFLMADCVDLSFTIRDLVESNGPEVANMLRKKAKQLRERSTN